MASVSTILWTKHSVLGQPAVIKKNQFPTSSDVYRLYDYCLKRNKYDCMQKRVTAVAHEVVSIYNTGSILVIDTKSVVNRIKKLIDKVKGLA